MDEFGFVLPDSRTTDVPHSAAETTRFQPPAFEVSIAYQFVQDPSADDKLAAPIVQPISEPHTG